jgi:hypothetical protein
VHRITDSETLTLQADGPFAFNTAIPYNGAYSVTVKTQPVGVTCTVSDGVGTGATADISKVTVVCSVDTYTIGGNVSGLPAGAQLALQNNAADTTSVAQNGAFEFATPVAFNGSYAVTASAAGSSMSNLVRY